MRAIISLRLEREAGLSMITKKRSKKDVFKTIFGVFLVMISMVVGVFGTVLTSDTVYADPETSETNTGNSNDGEATNGDADANGEENGENEAKTEGEGAFATLNNMTADTCKDSLGEIGWLVCPTTGKIAEAVDWLYDKIEGILKIDPVSTEDGSPIYEIWKYCLSLTNIVFVIFLLVVIYSQITGVGISNYGIKKVLPKLIVTALLVNLSFLICSLAVDVSNIVGNGLRGVFTSVEESVIASSAAAPVAGDAAVEAKITYAKVYSSMAGGAALTVLGGAIAVETGVIWMLIPVLLGAIVAVVTGLITIALRQAVVALLIMISPLAIVAYILPNTEQWFKKWKNLLVKMLVFYPMFSLLFGASSLAGFAIVASAKDGFGVLLGTAVQIFPLFFSWKLMQMSGTFLGTINARMHALAAKPLATNRAWADSHKALSRARHLERNQMPSAKLMNFLAYRRTNRETETDSINDYLKAKYTAKSDAKDYTGKGKLSRRGQRRYDRQALTMRYEQFSKMHEDNLNKGFGEHEAGYKNTIAEMRGDLLSSRGVYSSAIKGRTYEERIKSLDMANMNAADDLKAETARGAEIEYQNAKGFFDRAIDAKFAEGDQRALLAGNEKHQMHPGVLNNPDNLVRYERWKKIMEGQDDGVQTVLADAASSLHAQAQIRRNKFQSAADLTPATQNVADHIGDLVRSPNMTKNIDAIIGGLRILNMRGDTDMVAKELEHNIVGILADSGNIELGTYASQAIANYAMFDVKDNDPVLRRFGKYINMQTAALYNDNDPEKRRTRKDVSWWEYVNSQYIEHDESGNVVYDDNGEMVIRKTRGMRELMLGTSYSGVERTAYKAQREGVRAASYDIDSNGNLSPRINVEKYLNTMDGLYDSTLANIIGDQFAYRSGSEQIMALAKDLTGIGKDGKWDWKYIFGDELKNPTLEQQASYIVRARDLVKKFLGGHVPSQISKSKTDMLQAIESQYALLDEVMYINDEGKEVVDLERLRELNEREFTAGDENTPGSYKNFLKEKRSAVKKRFQESFKEEAVKGFAKQFRRGYQGEAKDLLIKLLDPEALYDYYYPNGTDNRDARRRRNVNDGEDEGMPVGDDLSDGVAGSGLYNDTRERIREIFERYSGTGNFDVMAFWDETKGILESSAEMGDLRATLGQFEEGLAQYTDIYQLYNDIVRVFFGDN